MMFQNSPKAMKFRQLLIPLVLVSSVILLAGCKGGSGSQPSNPFAQNLAVPPPATFSSQESFLGQTPGSFVPQTPASIFSPSGAVSPTQPTTPAPANIPFSDAANNSESEQGATLFTATEKETGWLPIDMASTNQTAFQALDAKVGSGNIANGFPTDTPESLIIGTSHVITTIVDESQPTTLTEPQTLQLYSGGYTQ